VTPDQDVRVAQEAWRVIDKALMRRMADLTPSEVSAWGLLRHFMEIALPEKVVQP
jgi:hypothetical protein